MFHGVVMGYFMAMYSGSVLHYNLLYSVVIAGSLPRGIWLYIN